MQNEIELIQRYAKELKKLDDNEQELFSYLNNIVKPDIDELIDFYRPASTTLQPVNLLRFDILNLLKEGNQVNSEMVAGIKAKIVEKDVMYFEKYGDIVVGALKNTPNKKKSPFASYKKNLSIFFPFIYTNPKREETRSALKKVVVVLEKELQLKNYKSHAVDFDGPQKYGASYCWIAFYPNNKYTSSHQEAYQLFMKICAEKIEAGIETGRKLTYTKPNNVEGFNTIQEAIQKLKDSKQTADEHNSKLISIIETGKEQSPSLMESQNKYESPNFWWLNANPQIWSIDSFKIGEIQTYTSHNKNGTKRRIYKYFDEVKPGDLVIGYETYPTKKVKAIYEITEGLHVDDHEGEIISFEIKEKVKYQISWDKLKETKGLEECEVLNNNQGSLFKLTAEEFNIIKYLSDGESTTNAKESKEVKVKPYSFSDDSDKPFLEEHEIKGIIESLEVKKNIVLQGPPGVGKTFIAKKIAYEMMKKIDDSKIKMVQFHQSYSYEDFIQGIRPSEDDSVFKVKNGVFFDFCLRAASEPSQKFFFIIDEINRGNLSKIFGELMMLIESDKRGKQTLPLTYSEKDDPEFSVPENLYIIGTMNTADRSLAIVDYALRRRFRFITLEPKFNIKFKELLSSKGFKKDFIEDITSKINSLNEKIEEDKNLGRGFLIGHSFFCGTKRGTEKEWFENIIKFEIEPLLEEYWFDDSEKVKKAINLLLS